LRNSEKIIKFNITVKLGFLEEDYSIDEEIREAVKRSENNEGI
jgi:hypothetical protein